MPQFHPDIRTLFLAGALMYLLDGLMIVLFWTNYRRYLAGTGHWVVAFLFFLGGALLIAFRDSIPVFLSYVLANSFYCIAYVLLLDGFRAIENASKRYRWNYAWIVLFAPFFYWFTLVDLNFRFRVTLEFILFAFFNFQIAALHRHRLLGRGHQKVTYGLIVLIFGSIGVLYLMVSVLIALYAGREDHVLKPGLPHYFIGFIQLYTTIGIVVSIILQINSKLLERSEAAERSLRDANAALVKEKGDKENLLVQNSKMAMVGEMMSAISHQWKQPINAISLIASDLEDQVKYQELTPDSAMEVSREIRKQIDFMAKTMEGFRNFFRPGSEDCDFDACTLIRETAELFSKPFKSQSIEMAIEEQEGLLVHGRPNEFKQVIFNLITNAREAIAEKGVKPGRIVFSFESRDGEVWIHITDNGGGLPSGMAPETLFQAYKTSGKAKGEGLGLSLVRMIVMERLKGRVFASNFRDGARFTIRLPIAGSGKAVQGVFDPV